MTCLKDNPPQGSPESVWWSSSSAASGGIYAFAASRRLVTSRCASSLCSLAFAPVLDQQHILTFLDASTHLTFAEPAYFGSSSVRQDLSLLPIRMTVRLLERDWKSSFRLGKTEHAPRRQVVRKTYFKNALGQG